MPGDQWNGLQVRINQCDVLNKPLFVGESGIHACGYAGGPPCTHPLCNAPNICYTQQERADFFEAKMDAFLNTNPGVGYLFWTYRDNYLMGQADNDPTFRFTSTDPLASVAHGFNAPSVGGIAEQPDVARLPAVTSASGDHSTALALAGAVLATVAVFGAGSWYVRRRRNP